MLNEHAAAVPQTSGLADGLAQAVISIDQAVRHQSQQLALHKQEFAIRKAQVLTINACQAQCTYLDVGGTHFHAGWETLQRHEPHYLSALVSGHFADPADSHGYMFVDRDPQWFAVVLAYLRHGTVYVPRDRAAVRILQREAAFYAVPELQRQVQFERYRMAVTFVGRRLHVYDADVKRWRPLRDPLDADGDAVVHMQGWWGKWLVTWGARVDGVLSLELLDTAAWAWKRLPLPGVRDVYMMDSWAERLMLLVEWANGNFSIQVLDPLWSWRCIALRGEHSPLTQIMALGDRLYVLTARSQAPPHRNRLMVYEHGEWRDLVPPPLAREGGTVYTGVPDRIIVFGGRNGGDDTCTVQQYVCSTGHWELLPDMRQPRGASVVVLWEGKVVITGRQTPGGRPLEVYDLATAQWVAWPQPDLEGRDLEVVVYEGGLFICDSNGSVKQYDPETRSWRASWDFKEDVWLDAVTLPRTLVWSVVMG